MPSDHRIIFLTGPARSGKDTVASMLKLHGYRRVALADFLRVEVCESLIHWRFPESIPSDLLADLTRFHVDVYDVWAKPTSDTVRRLLQWWGTEYRRARKSDYWAQKLAGAISPRGRYVVSDVRFPSEPSDAANWLRVYGAHVSALETWRVERSGIGPANGHVSEQLFDHIRNDRLIRNDSTLQDLAVRVANAAKEFHDSPNHA